jgi:ParB-like chromosome segregation protein Spo0J
LRRNPRRRNGVKKQQASNGAAEQIAPSLVALAVNIRELHLDPKNVRRHPERNIEAIQASLRRFGQQAPVVYVVRDGRKIVIKGSGLLRAAQALGWKRLAAVRSDLAGDAAKAYAIADNRTTDLSEFDEEQLAKQLEEL